jgi:hypothetical protein
MKRFHPFLFASFALVTACTSSAGNGGGVAATGTTDTTSSGADTSTASDKNKATISAKDDSGKSDPVSVDKTASKADSQASGSTKIGAMNAGKQLVLYVASSTSFLEVHVNTEKFPLPMNGIPLGAPNSDAWATYSLVGPTTAAILNSKDTGTLDITGCPDKEGAAAVGKLNGVVVVNEAPIGPKTVTLDGTFHLVYFGGAGELACTVTPPVTDKDAGSTDTSLAKGGTCAFQLCDGDPKSTRHCCKYFPCMDPCTLQCGLDAQKCVQACSPSDPMCAMTCGSNIGTCIDACFSKCGVDAECKQNYGAVEQCKQDKGVQCEGGDVACPATIDACCDAYKAAF